MLVIEVLTENPSQHVYVESRVRITRKSHRNSCTVQKVQCVPQSFSSWGNWRHDIAALWFSSSTSAIAQLGGQFSFLRFRYTTSQLNGLCPSLQLDQHTTSLVQSSAGAELAHSLVLEGTEIRFLKT